MYVQVMDMYIYAGGGGTVKSIICGPNVTSTSDPTRMAFAEKDNETGITTFVKKGMKVYVAERTQTSQVQFIPLQ